MRKKFKVTIPNLSSIIEVTLNDSGTVQGLIDQVIYKLDYPKQARVTVKFEGQEKDLNAPLREISSAALELEFYLPKSIIAIHPALGEKSFTINALGSPLQIEEALSETLVTLPYRVRVIDQIMQQGSMFCYPPKVNYQVLASFVITYENEKKFFQVEAFQTIGSIKKTIKDTFQFGFTFKLQYEEIWLDDNDLYYQYLIPDNSGLKLVGNEKLYLLIQFGVQTKRYQVAAEENVWNLMDFLRKQFYIKKQSKFNLEYCNSPLAPRLTFNELHLKDDDILVLKFVGKDIKLYLQSDSEQLTFPVVVTSNQKISDLDNLRMFKDTVVIFMLDSIILDKNKSFEETKIGDKRVIKFRRDMVNIKVNYGENVHIYQVSRQDTGKQLMLFVAKKLNLDLQHFQLLYGNQACQLNKKLEEFYQSSYFFEIKENNKLSVTIYVESFNHRWQESFNFDATLLDVKKAVQLKFAIPKLNVIVPCSNEFADNMIQLRKLDLSQEIIYSVISEITLRFHTDTGVSLQEGKCNLGTILKDELAKFCNPDEVTCYFNNQKLELNKQFVDFNFVDNDTIIISGFPAIIYFQRKSDDKRSRGQFRCNSSIKEALSQITKRQADCYFKNVQITNLNRTFQDLKISNEDVILYEELMQVSFKQYRNELTYCKQVKPTTSVEDAIRSVVKEEVFLLFRDQLIDPKGNFQQLGINDGNIIEFGRLNITLKIIKQNQAFAAEADVTINIGQLKINLQLSDQGMDFYYNNERLSDEINLYRLGNGRNELILHYQELQSEQASLYLPSMAIGVSVILVDALNDSRLEETVEPSSKIEDFIQRFQNKNSVNGVTLFYEGEELDRKKTFEEVGIKNGAEIELQR